MLSGYRACTKDNSLQLTNVPGTYQSDGDDDDDDGCVIHELQLDHNHDIDRLHCHLVIAISWLKAIIIKIILSLPLACCSAAVFSDGGFESAHRSTENRKHVKWLQRKHFMTNVSTKNQHFIHFQVHGSILSWP